MENRQQDISGNEKNIPNNTQSNDMQGVMELFCRAMVKAASDEKASEPPQPEQKEVKTIDLVGLVYRVLENLKYVVLVALVCAILGGMYAKYCIVPYYTATAKLYILGQTESTINMSSLQVGTVLTLDYQEVFRTWEVHEMVREKLDLPYNYNQMQSMIRVSNPEDTRVLYITAMNTDAKLATDIANTYAEAAKTFIMETMGGEEPKMFSIALVPGSAVYQDPMKYVIMGGMLGAVLAMGIITLLFVLDERPRAPEEVARAAGVPIFGVIPVMSKQKKRARGINLAKQEWDQTRQLDVEGFPDLDYGCTEAMNVLYTNLSYCGNTKTILVTSRHEREGKSFISMNLLRTFASLNKKVVLIDADMRRLNAGSRYHMRFDAGPMAGLTQYLAGQCALENIVYSTDLPNAYIIPLGSEVANPLKLLNTPEMTALMEHLRENYDVVLVDTPPAGMFVDAIDIAKHCDGAIEVVSYNRGKNRDLTDMTQSINKTGCRTLGVVLNKVQFRALANRRYYYSSGKYAVYYNAKYSRKVRKNQRYGYGYGR